MADYNFQESSVPAFQDALKKQLKARNALTTVAVVVGPPSPGVAETSQWICFLDVDGTEKWASLGRLQKEENFRQRVYISVLTRDGEGDSTRGRDAAFALRKEVAEQLRDDPTVSHTVWQCQIAEKCEFYPRLGINVADASGTPTVDLSWREAAIYFDIHVKNRLTHV